MTRTRVVRSEWIKLRSVRSNLIGVVVAVIAAVGLGVLFAGLGDAGGPGGPPTAGSDVMSLSLAGFRLAELVFGVLGVLFVTSEYATGLIRSTFAAVTERLPVVWAKAAVYGAVVLVAATFAAIAAVLAGAAVYTGSSPLSSFTDATIVRSILGSGVYAAGVALMGVALGFLIRATAAGVGTLLAGLLVIPGLASLLPGSAGDTITKLLPSNAGSSFTSAVHEAGALSPGTGFAVFLLWVVGLLAAAAWAVRHRDA